MARATIYYETGEFQECIDDAEHALRLTCSKRAPRLYTSALQALGFGVAALPAPDISRARAATREITDLMGQEDRATVARAKTYWLSGLLDFLESDMAAGFSNFEAARMDLLSQSLFQELQVLEADRLRWAAKSGNPSGAVRAEVKRLGVAIKGKKLKPKFVRSMNRLVSCLNKHPATHILRQYLLEIRDHAGGEAVMPLIG